MHTMFTTKHHRSSNASARAEAEAAMQIAQTMASNCTNTLDTNIIQSSNLPSLAASLASNPISQYYDIVGKPAGTAGPELAWRIIDATRRSDGKEVSIWFFDRKWVEKFGKSAKRVDYIVERLKRGAVQLDRHRHAKIVSVYNQLIETNDTLAFATEPVLGSLANITGYLEDGLSQGVPSSLREFTFNDFEIKYGLLQIAEALVFLHHTRKSINGCISPQSIIVNKFVTWKLAGFEFLEKCNDDDPALPVTSMAFTSKFPKMSQIDLDFSAPEIQCSNAMSQQSNMFSLGLLICSIFNNGRSPIQANLNTTTYLKQLETRAASDYLLNSYFEDTGVRALQCLDIIYLRDNLCEATFYHNLRNVMDLIPKKLWLQHILPHLAAEFQNPEVSAAALEPVLHIIQFCTMDEYQNHIFPLIQKIREFPKSVQATVTLLENISILKSKTGERHIKSEILPMLLSGIQSPIHQIQCAAFKAFSEVIDHIDENTIRDTVLPKAQNLLKTNDSIQLQYITLCLIDKLVANLEKTEILDEIIPLLISSKLTDPIVLRPTLRIYQQLLNNKLVGLNVTLLATQIMPSLTPSLVSPNLTINDFNNLADLLQKNFFNIIAKSQRNKLKLERMSSYSIEQQYPNHNFDQQIGYAHKVPGSRLNTRRQSISVDNVQRQSISSNYSSPEINYLRVNCTNLPFRRHSDNAIEPPRILINQPNNSSSSVHLPTHNYQSNQSIQNANFGNASLTVGSNANQMPKRRHSSVNPTELKGISNASNFFNQARNFAKNSVTGSGSALNSLSSAFGLGAQNKGGSRYADNKRRYSAHTIFSQSPNSSSNFLNQLGSNVQSLFSKY